MCLSFPVLLHTIYNTKYFKLLFLIHIEKENTTVW
jgi:hypothetical protein